MSAKARRPLARVFAMGPVCEGCGCTEEAACPGGCWWDENALEQGRYICSECAPDLMLPDGDEEDAP